MKLKAIKSFHTSGLGMIHARTEFEAHDALGQELADKGLAEVIESSTDTVAGAADSQPHAKQEPALINKMEPAPESKRSRRKAKTEAPSELSAEEDSAEDGEE
jgi:hypothetical protein